MKVTDTCVSHIYENTCFDLLTPEESALIENNSVFVEYKKGEVVCKQGSFASHVMYIEEGLVKVYIEGKPKNLILTITPRGNFLALQAIYEGNNVFPFSVSTYTDSRLRLIDLNTLKKVILGNPTFGYRIINILNESTSQIYGRFFSLTQKQLHGRLADILLCISRRIFKKDSFDLPLTRSDLSDITSMSTESVIRILKDFKDNNLIDLDNKSISLKDFDRLQQISDKG